MTWMHGPDHDSGEWTALRQRLAEQRADLDGFLTLLAGLRTRFATMRSDLTSLGALVDDLRTAQGTHNLRGGNPLPQSDGHAARTTLPVHPTA